MAPLLDHNDGKHNDNINPSLPRFLVIGAGSRGNAYARATVDSGQGIIDAVVEPVAFKRHLFGRKYIWPKGSGVAGSNTPGQTFTDWTDFITYETQRRQDAEAGKPVRPGVVGVFVCVRDELHMAVVAALAPLGLHMLCEKPLATNLADCRRIQNLLAAQSPRVFAIGHVLRYSPHNMLLRRLVREERAIGDVVSVEHVEPVGWWHFAHSYVRGHWRKQSHTAPSLLTKSCHDIDFLLWMLCSPVRNREPGTTLPSKERHPHLPATIASTGSLRQFRRVRKPPAAGAATNCLSCPLQKSCIYSAPRLYDDRHLAKGITAWPLDIVNPEIETLYTDPDDGPGKARAALHHTLAEDYDAATTSPEAVAARPWFGRCVWESDNDVCDDQVVTIEWTDEEEEEADGAVSTNDDQTHQHQQQQRPENHLSKSATFHMISQTLAQCDRRGRIYGSTGEICYDSATITVHDFVTGESRSLHPEVPTNSHHGGGDAGLTLQFVRAVAAVEKGQMGVEEAQVRFLDVILSEAVRSHAVVFAAEEARREGRVVDWREWWERNMGAEV